MGETEESNKKLIPEVRIMPGGPIILKGNFSFRDSSGKIINGEQEILLCRCGESKNKPYCDCSHKSMPLPD
jgi:CDGSH-type Zn-finger protein